MSLNSNRGAGGGAAKCNGSGVCTEIKELRKRVVLMEAV